MLQTSCRVVGKVPGIMLASTPCCGMSRSALHRSRTQVRTPPRQVETSVIGREFEIERGCMVKDSYIGEHVDNHTLKP